MKRFTPYLLIVLFVIPAKYVWSQGVITLRQAVETALANNIDVKQADLAVQNARITFNQARYNRLPDLFSNLNQGIAQGRNVDPGTNTYVNDKISFGNYGLSTNVTLFSGSRLKNLIKQNASGYEAGKLELQQAKEELSLNVILAYLQILNNQDLLLQSINQQALTTKQVDRLEILNKEGALIPAQLYELRGQFANDELSVIANRNAVETAKLTLAQLMNIPYTKDLQVQPLDAGLAEMLFTDGAAAVYEMSATKLAVIKAASMRKEAAAAAVKVARSGFYPTVSFGADLYTTYSSAANKDIFINKEEVPSGDFVNINGTSTPVITTRSNFNTEKITYLDQFKNNYGTSVNVGVRIPIFNAYQARNNVSLAKNELKNREYIEENARLQLRQSVEQAFLDMKGAYEMFKTLEKQVKDFEASYKIAEVRFNAGATNQVEFLIAKNNYERAQINLITARYDHMLRVKILEYYQGKPLY